MNNSQTIDFSSCTEVKYKHYGGANGRKRCVLYEDKVYMLKLLANADIHDSQKINSCYSEYITCHIFNELGFDAQNTLLGRYTYEDGQSAVVVACEDFTVNGKELNEFAKIKNWVLDTSENGFGVELDLVLDAIDKQKDIDAQALREFFWEMFIVDAFVGNFDRHNGNWGLLVDKELKTCQFAPIYDCGSCLYPAMKIDEMKALLKNKTEIDNRIFVFPNSALKINGNKINYFDFISSLSNADCNKALRKIAEKINAKSEIINSIVDDTPFILPIQKEFYKTMLRERKEKIIDFSCKKTQKTPCIPSPNMI